MGGILQGALAGVTNAMGDPTLVNRQNEKRQRSQDFSDEYRQNEIKTSMTAVNDLQKKVALLLNPDTMQPLPGKEAQAAQFGQEIQRLNGYIKNLYNPNFNPSTGGPQPESPLRKLAEKVHLAKPQSPEVAKTAGQQQQDIQGIIQRAGSMPPQTDRQKLARELGRDPTDEEMQRHLKIADKPASLKYSSFDIPGSQVKVPADAFGNPIDPQINYRMGTSGDETQYFPVANKPHAATKVVKDPNSSTGYSYATFDGISGKVYSLQPDAPPQRGLIVRESISTDLYGNKTVTISGPLQEMGGKGAPAAAAPSTPQGKGNVERKPGTGQLALDAQGHIPANKAINENVRQAANQLLDGADINRLDSKVRQAAASVAEKAGWGGQGKFTPKDMLLVRESAATLKSLSTSKSLEVLNNSASRLKLQQVLQDPQKRNIIGQAMQGMTAERLTKDEQEFVTLYNQAVGRISGLSQLVRSGRPTEATIERLKKELPNPWLTTDANHARRQLSQIQNEIDIAMQKGNFADLSSGSSGGDNSKADEILKKHGVLQ